MNPDDSGFIDAGSIHETQAGETPINEDDREFLLPAFGHIQSRDEQNRAEAENIALGLEWLDDQGDLDPGRLLSQWFLRELHREMFGQVWSWAGKPLTRETTIGIDPAYITERWEQLLGDARFWIDQQTYSPDEICVRLHHRQVAIHPFVNGNGRHARITANKLAEVLGLSKPGRDRFTWGFSPEAPDRETVRREYLNALVQADRGDYSLLVEIALRPRPSAL